MRTLVPILAGFGLVVATAASAEPAKLSEGELGRVAAGQAMEFSLATLQTTTTISSTTNNTNDADTATSVFNSDATAAQDLAAESTNTVSALGMLDSRGVTASGNASAVLTGTVDNIVP